MKISFINSCALSLLFKRVFNLLLKKKTKNLGIWLMVIFATNDVFQAYHKPLSENPGSYF